MSRYDMLRFNVHSKANRGQLSLKHEIKITRLPSNLRPTTRECAHLVTRGHFRSRDKDTGHTIRSAIAKNPMLHANVMALRFIEPELWPI